MHHGPENGSKDFSEEFSEADSENGEEDSEHGELDEGELGGLLSDRMEYLNFLEALKNSRYVNYLATYGPDHDLDDSH